MTIDPETTVGALVTERIGRSAVLEAHSIDYCCGGHRTLGEVCHSQGLDPAALIESLEHADALDNEPPSEWAQLSIAELVDHIESTHHEFVRESIGRIQRLLTKVVSVHADNHPELHQVRSLFDALAADMGPHMMKEEQVLFPMMRELATAESVPAFHCGTIANPIRMMGLEHDMVGDYLAQLRLVTSGYAVPDDGCDSYRVLYAALEEFEADTHLHVHKENNVLFPAALARENDVATAS